MIRVYLFFVFSVILSSVSCVTYEEYHLTGRIYMYDNISKDDVSSDDGVYRKNISPEEKAKWRRYYERKYFAWIRDFSDRAKINNRALESIRSGEYREAELLLTQLLDDRDFYRNCALNNLGLVYEIQGRYDRALDSYLEACTSDSGNEYFRWNFNSLSK